MMARAILYIAVEAHDASAYGVRGVNIDIEMAEVFGFICHIRGSREADKCPPDGPRVIGIIVS